MSCPCNSMSASPRILNNWVANPNTIIRPTKYPQNVHASPKDLVRRANAEYERWGLLPGTHVLGYPLPSVRNPETTVPGQVPHLTDSMVLEAKYARTHPISWAKWPLTAPDWAQSRSTKVPGTKHTLMVHPVAHMSSPIVVNRGGVGPALARLVTDFSGTSLNQVYNAPFSTQIKQYNFS